jgi:hypothetical protein
MALKPQRAIASMAYAAGVSRTAFQSRFGSAGASGRPKRKPLRRLLDNILHRAFMLDITKTEYNHHFVALSIMSRQWASKRLTRQLTASLAID